MAKELHPIVDWKTVDWQKAEQSVYRLQKRIFRASGRGETAKVHNLQRKLDRSWYKWLLAVRKVTQDNQGKKTAGVDGVKSLTTTQRVELAEKLTRASRKKKRYKAKPVRRVWIPKPGKQEKRPLGIPVMEDRARQAGAKMALEPEWEAKFEADSYGFRPGRSPQDAVQAIFLALRFRPKYVVDADIKGMFDHISHEALLEKLQTYPAMRRTIREWLKAGVMDGADFSPTEEGTPQGGVVSPLLANIALHGLGEELAKGYRWTYPHPQTIRYADDFVVICPTMEAAEKAKKQVEAWLKKVGLELNLKKTRIISTLKEEDREWGFEFLGAQIRQYEVGKYQGGKDTHGKTKCFKTIIKPSPEAQKRHRHSLKTAVRKYRGAPQEALIKHLNPIIRGWTAYHHTWVASECFASMEHILDTELWKWAKWRHQQKGWKWRKSKYWKRVEIYDTENDKVITRDQFQSQKGVKLFTHSQRKIIRHKKVQETASPYDGDLIYWATRLYDHTLTASIKGKVIKLQKGRCAWCGLYLKPGDTLQLDHVIPTSLGGKWEVRNLSVYHKHCHDQKSARDGSHDPKRRAEYQEQVSSVTKG